MEEAPITNLKLNDAVVTNHAEILLNTSYGLISFWNITPVQENYDRQIEAIVARFNNELVKIQIIIGATQYFYRQLDKYLQSHTYQIYKSTNQDIGILFNLNYFTLSQAATYAYESTNGDLNMPVVYLKTLDRKFLVLAAINNTDTQTGLKYIQAKLKQIQHSLKDYQVCNYILAGSFNISPIEVQATFTDLTLKIPDYYTVLDSNTASYHDMIWVYHEKDTEILPIIYTSPYTQALGDHIQKCLCK